MRFYHARPCAGWHRYRALGKTFTVKVEEDGRIYVKAGDCLSKYSMAIHKNPFVVYEYAREDSAGVKRPLGDVNMIFVHDKLYHIPTYKDWARHHPVSFPDDVIVGVRYKEQIIRKTHVRNRFDDLGLDLPGEYLEWAEKYHLSLLAHCGHGAVEVAEIFEAFERFIEHGGGLAKFVSWGVPAVAIAHSLYEQLEVLAAISNAREADQKLYALRAMAYATTAWAFDLEPQGAPPDGFKKKIRSLHESECNAAWAKTARETPNALEKRAKEMKLEKKFLQFIYRSVADGEPEKLASVLIEGMEEKLPEPHAVYLLLWRSTYDLKYPN